MHIRIGIVINDFPSLNNWKLRLIQALVSSPEYDNDIVFITPKIISSRTQGGFSYNLVNNFSRLLLSFQGGVEKRFFFKERYTVDIQGLLKTVKNAVNVKTQQVSMDGQGGIRPEDAKKIQDENLSVILNLTDGQMDGGFGSLAKHGVWFGMHRDWKNCQNGPLGFWEVLEKKAAVGFTLVKSKGDTKGVQRIDTAFFNRSWSMVETVQIVQEGCVSVVLKNIRRLAAQQPLSSENMVCSSSSFVQPGFTHVFSYLVSFYLTVLGKVAEKLGATFFKLRPERWSLFLGKGSFMQANLEGFEPITIKKDEFWADPFLFRHEEKDYIFFENFSYKHKRGKISCGVISDKELIDIVDVLDLPYHLSYPYIFEDNGAIFLMPETSENKRLEIYKSVKFPTQWELYTTAFEGESVADAFFFDDENNEKWLFVNKQAAETAPMNSELFIYKTDSIALENLQAHAQNPVIIDARTARNGGSIFKHDKQLYRPSQRNVDSIYGRSLNINRIEKLTIEVYKEENIAVISPDFNKKLVAMHHLHQAEDYFVFDAAFKRK